MSQTIEALHVLVGDSCRRDELLDILKSMRILSDSGMSIYNEALQTMVAHPMILTQLVVVVEPSVSRQRIKS